MCCSQQTAKAATATTATTNALEMLFPSAFSFILLQSVVVVVVAGLSAAICNLFYTLIACPTAPHPTARLSVCLFVYLSVCLAAYRAPSNYLSFLFYTLHPLTMAKRKGYNIAVNMYVTGRGNHKIQIHICLYTIYPIRRSCGADVWTRRR